MFNDHLNSALDDYPVTIGVGMLEPETEAEPTSAPATAVKTEPRKQTLQQGRVGYDRACDAWYYQWNDNGRRQKKTLGHSDTLPDKAAAWAAAEPLRLAFIQRQQQEVESLDAIQRDAKWAVQEETAEQVEALFAAEKRKHGNRQDRKSVV